MTLIYNYIIYIMVSSNAILQAVDDFWPAGTPITASEVAEELNYPERTIHIKLESLAADGILQMKQIEADSYVWWRPVESEQERSGDSVQGRPQVRSHPAFNSKMIGVIVWGEDVTIRDANDAFLEMMGLEYEEALGMSWEELTPEEFHPAAERHIVEVEETGRGVPYEKQYYDADGSRWWGLFESRRLNDNEKIEFVVEITERNQYKEMLEQKNDHLKRFTDALSHDLRSPLSLIDARLRLYRETGDVSYLDAVETTTERMEQLIEDLLQVARSGQVINDQDAVRLNNALEIAQEGILPESATYEYDSVQPVMADADRLIQAFENLFQNSVAHGRESVTIRVGPCENGFYFEDDGSGIPDTDRERIFEHGYTTREDGTGYGLSTVRSIINAHGWDIAVTDSDDGGARFEISGVSFSTDQ